MQRKKKEYYLSICLIFCAAKILKICADKNHQIWRFWDQSFGMTFAHMHTQADGGINVERAGFDTGI